MLKKQKAIITGATSGIGKEIAIQFVKNGAHVAILGTNEEKAKEVLKKLEDIKKEDQKVLYKLVDVSKTLDVEKVFIDIIKELDGIDILINNAGITKDNFLIRISEEDWDRVIAVNLKSLYNTSKVVLRYMMKKKYGRIINISSVVGIIGNAAQTNYAASKAGIIGFSKSLAKEVAKKNIYVNCIAPGFIETKMTKNLPDKVKEKLLSNISMNRFGSSLDVANVAMFLASNLSNYITGQVICVDGGMVM